MWGIGADFGVNAVDVILDGNEAQEGGDQEGYYLRGYPGRPTDHVCNENQNHPSGGKCDGREVRFLRMVKFPILMNGPEKAVAVEDTEPAAPERSDPQAVSLI